MASLTKVREAVTKLQSTELSNGARADVLGNLAAQLRRMTENDEDVTEILEAVAPINGSFKEELQVHLDAMRSLLSEPNAIGDVELDPDSDLAPTDNVDSLLDGALGTEVGDVTNDTTVEATVSQGKGAGNGRGKRPDPNSFRQAILRTFKEIQDETNDWVSTKAVRDRLKEQGIDQDYVPSHVASFKMYSKLSHEKGKGYKLTAAGLNTLAMAITPVAAALATVEPELVTA